MSDANQNNANGIEFADQQFISIAYDGKIKSEHNGDTDCLWESGTGLHSLQTKNTGCQALGDNTVAEGLNTVAASNYSHTEGYASKTVVDTEDLESHGQASHAEGTGTVAKGTSSHAEGGGTLARGMDSHAEGNSTSAMGGASHAEGNWTITNNLAEHAEGTFNLSNKASDTFGDAGNTLHSIGIGHSTGELQDDRKNAFEIMQNGDAYLIGVGGYDGTNPNEATTLQESIGGGSSSSFITIVRDSQLHYENQGTDEESWFEARISESLFPSDFLSSRGKYNLFVIISGNDDGNILSYTANHFCSQVGSDNSFTAFCYDGIVDMDITHKTTIFKQSGQPAYVIQYTGLLSGSRQLPEEGSYVSIYLQRLF